MHLRNLKIGNQLRFGLGTILLSVALLGAMAWRMMDGLWLQTQGLYEHPLTVRRAIGNLNADVMSMHDLMGDLCMAESDRERLAIAQAIDNLEADGQGQLVILRASYLGPQKDVDDVSRVFLEWKAIRAETLRALQAGKTSEAINRVKFTGPDHAEANELLRHIEEISKFAKNRGDRFFQEATDQKQALQLQMGIMLGFILLLTVAISYFLLREIKEPLQELTAATHQFRQGKLEARCRYTAGNEIGELSAAFNEMAGTLQTELRVNQNAARLAGVMLREEDLHSFCRSLLKELLEHTGSQVGAVYLLNEPKTHFELCEAIGLSGAGRAAFSATDREGEFGLALASRQIQRVTNIPADSRFTFAAVSGNFVPREILTIPVVANQEVSLVISLASLHPYPAPALQLVNEIWSVLTARLNGVLAFRQLHDFSRQLEFQNRELEAQKRELGAQRDELNEQNIELEMQKQQLDEASRLKSAFLSNMSHELRTPLNSVIALSGVLHHRLAHTIPAEEYGYLEIIRRNGQHLLSLINDILDLSRIESGREEILPARFSVRDLVAEIVAMLEPQARQKNLPLLNHVPADLAPLTSDPVKCRHILQNLVGNAVKFTDAGQVEIAARQDGDAIHITVTDTGIGIAADKLAVIFEEFRQADDSTSRRYGGTGLGLAIAKKYAVLLRGDVTVESAPGRGSTFTLRLPLTLELPEAGAVEDYSVPAVPPEAPAGRGGRILLVEDSEPAIIQITDILTQHGYQVEVARNGKEALERIGQAPPDAMILDLTMPEVDGFQVLRTIRGAEPTAQLPVLILTAKYVTKEELSFLKGNHIRQLIQKGNISAGELLAAVARMVAPAPAPVPARKIRPPAGKPVVLVVEDNADNLTTLRALLQETCTVVETTAGRQALALARQHRPDLILMDIALQDMSGIEVLVAIRQDAALRHIPVVAVTASVMKGERENILAHGFDAYIPKPIDEALLQRTIRAQLYG
jgi:signal transduction histidine kinase/DNA-binding response OmpR family regulator